MKLIDKEFVIQESLKRAISYTAYRKLVSEHVDGGTSTGPVQNQELAQYTLLNDSRMRRLDKTTKIPADIMELFQNYNENRTWLIITESWCGDAAQSMPVINKLQESVKTIDFQVVLRDENPQLMNAFLTDGSMSIPKLIVIDNNTQQILGNWGPRPSVANKMVAEYKADYGKLTAEFKQDLQVWYNKDKGESIAEDLADLLV